MHAYRNILRTPLLGRFLVPWDMAVPAFWLMVGFMTGLNLIFLFFCLFVSMTGLFWIRKSGEGTIRGRIFFLLRERVYLVE